MKIISLHIEDEIIALTDSLVKKAKVSRTKYINDAINFYNKFQKRKELEKELLNDSLLARESSMEVLADFEALDDEI